MTSVTKRFDLEQDLQLLFGVLRSFAPTRLPSSSALLAECSTPSWFVVVHVVALSSERHDHMDLQLQIQNKTGIRRRCGNS